MADPDETGGPKRPDDEDETGKSPSLNRPRKKFEWDKTQKITATLAAMVAIIGGVGGALAWMVSMQPPDATVREVKSPHPEQTMPVTNVPPMNTPPMNTAVITPGYGWSKNGVNSSNDFVAVTAAMDPAPSCNGGGPGWVFRQKASDLAPLPWAEQQAKADDWARANGGIPLAGNHIQLTLQELNDQAFIIDSISARVTHRSKPNVSTFPDLSGGCGGITQSFFQVNLDEGDNPQATPVSATGFPPVPLPHKLDAQDRFETWNVIVNTSQCDCEFVLAFNFTAAGQPHTYEVSLPDGKPWRVSAAPGISPVERDANGAWPDTGTPAPGSSTAPAR